MMQRGLDTREVARRVLELEGAGGGDPEELARAADTVCAKLHGELVNLFGPTGVHALLGRALHLARRDFPFLREVVPVVDPGGCLRGLDDSLRGRETAEADASVVAFVGHLISLLVAFLGEELGVYPIRKIWPESGRGAAPQPPPEGTE